MSRLLIASALLVAAVVVAAALRRRTSEPPTQAAWAVPSQLDRHDFERPDAPWLVVVFSSTACQACEGALSKASVLASSEVAVQDVSYQARKDLHERYAIDAAPTILVADQEGVVRASFVSTPSASDLWAAVAAARSEDQPPA
jgi:hypothetical protein